jgi:pyrimidine 5'-nucleotidase
MRYTTLFFDLDDTLYSSGNGLWAAIRQRMTDYMAERLGLPPATIPRLREQYYMTYGTTLRGLQKHHTVDTDDFLQYVHDVPVDKFLQPLPELKALIESLPQKRWIFTNADEAHARRVLRALRLEECFSGIVDGRATNFACKPEPQAYRLAMQMAGESDPRRCVMLDDSPRNLAPAHTLGFATVLVGSPASPDMPFTCAIPRVLDLPQAMPELWEASS